MSRRDYNEGFWDGLIVAIVTPVIAELVDRAGKSAYDKFVKKLAADIKAVEEGK